MNEPEDAVEPQIAEPIEQVMDQQVEPEAQESNETSPTMIPLSVAQKLRQQKRDLELELQWERQRNATQQASVQQLPPEEDNSRYETATKEDLLNSQAQMVRDFEEKLWIRQNAEKYEMVNANLPQFLKQRPHLARAINDSPNRYEEAYVLMEALTPKQQKQMAQAPTPKKEAPNAPGGVPKAAALNEAVDVMNMSDSEFSAWRQSKKRNR